MASEVESVLSDVGLITLLPRFISEIVDINVILAASDQDLIRLGISTIGDRCRLRDVCRRRRYYNTSTTSTASMNSTSRSITTPIVSSNSQNQNTVNNFPDHSNSSSSFFSQVREERSLLFAPCRARRGSSSRTTSTTSTGRSASFCHKKPGSKTWTATFVCLADRLATKLPNYLKLSNYLISH